MDKIYVACMPIGKHLFIIKLSGNVTSSTDNEKDVNDKM